MVMDGRRRTALVIDDEEFIRALLGEVLELGGYTVAKAADGQGALEVLRGWRPDVIVLDLTMPGMDGLAFLAEQRRRGLAPDVPTAVLSGRYDTPARCPESGLVFLPKPFEPAQLLAALDELVTRADAEHSGHSLPIGA
jgi:CheY-like chemotaxis protein